MPFAIRTIFQALSAPGNSSVGFVLERCLLMRLKARGPCLVRPKDLRCKVSQIAGAPSI